MKQFQFLMQNQLKAGDLLKFISDSILNPDVVICNMENVKLNFELHRKG